MQSLPILRTCLRSLIAALCLCSAAFAADKPRLERIAPIPAQPSDSAKKWAEKTLKKLSLEEKVGQMIQVRGIMGFYNDADPDLKQLVDEIRKYHIGGVLLSVKVDAGTLQHAQPYEAAMTANTLQRLAAQKVPLIFAVDFERGPSMRLAATPQFPHAMAFGATYNPEYAERFGRIVGEESRAMGIEWNYFPIADVNINPANPIINTRSFGEDPQEVGAMSAAYIRGSHATGMLATAKHFPGHGDTDTDSHLDLSRVNGDINRVNSVELPPFKQDIAAGVDAVMVAHVAFPALEPDPNKVSTISKNVVTGLLRDKLGFNGVVVTDAMEMKGLTKLFPNTLANPSGAAAVAAVLAGDDLITLPSDLDGAYNGILQAVKSGQIPKSRIDESVRRLLLAKAEVGLDKGGYVDVDQLQYKVGKPESFALAQEIADHSVTLVRDDAKLLPLVRTARPQPQQGTSNGLPAYLNQASGGDAANLGVADPLLALLFVDNVRGEWGRTMEQQIKARVPQARVVWIDNRTAALEADSILQLVPRYKRIVAAVYSIPQPGRPGVDKTSVNAMALSATTGTLLQKIIDTAADRTAVIAMGSPYTILSYPNIRTYLCTYSTVSTSDNAAVKALFGEMPIQGKLPVTLPNIAQRGEGIQAPASTAAANPSNGSF